MGNADLMENIISATGGCGLHQLLTCIIIHFSRMPATWSVIAMAFIGQNPGFYCNTMVVDPHTLDAFPFDNISAVGLCSLDETSKCVSYKFRTDMSTAATEWNLVCQRKWIVGLITSLQMVGCVCGCFSFGYLSDAYGRKPTYFAGVLIIVTFNIFGYFCQSWEVYVLIRVILGLATGATTTTMYLLMVEFIPMKWRSVVTAVPSQSIGESTFAFASWLLQDWRAVHLANAVVGAPVLLAYWFLPESFRWLVTRRKVKKARQTVYTIAAFNGREKPDLSELFETSDANFDDTDDNKKHSIFALFKTTDIRKVTIGLIIAWFTVGFGYYGMIFGANSLSGNLFLNLFLITIIDTPFAVPAGILANRFGRRKCCIVAMSLSGTFAAGVGALQYSGFLEDTPITTVMALIAKIACTCSLVGIRIYTLELYPTLVRSIGFGFQNTVYRFASAVVPLVLTLNDDIAGILYFVTGILMTASAIVTFFLPETANKSLPDRIIIAKEKSGQDENCTSN